MANPLTVPFDPNIQQRQAAEPGASIWVSASAGTGKTKVLTDRVLSLLINGTHPQRILCLTFTRAAAAEMSSRIADRLGQWTMEPEEALAVELEMLLGFSPDAGQLRLARQLFARVLDTPGGMNIQTIHAFCQSLLGRFPLEANVPPHFALMDERDAEEMLISAREILFNLARSGGDEDLAQALSVVTGHIHEAQFPELLADLTRARGRLRRLIDGQGGVDRVIANINSCLNVSPGETPSAVIEDATSADAYDQLGLKLSVEALAEGSKTDQERGRVIKAWLSAGATIMADFDVYADAYLTASRKSGPPEIRKKLVTNKVAKANPGVPEILDEEARRLIRVFLHLRAVFTAESSAALLRLGGCLLDVYQKQKEARALLDYDDLILKAGELLHREGVAPWVLFKLDGGIDHVLIDEAQDTSPDQWRVVEALVDEFFAGIGSHETPRTIFAVGDIKQSIYSFQGADPASFGAMRDLFQSRMPVDFGDFRQIDLTVSFRSTNAVLAVVDAVFAMGGAADGVTLDGKNIHHEAWRGDDGGLVEFWPAVAPLGGEEPSAWKPPVERIRGDSPQTRLARLIAGRIAAMVNGKEILKSQGRPIEPGDIMVLVRRRSGFVEDLVRSLKERKIGVAGVDRMVLTEQIAVMDLIALGRFLLLPEDDLTLATVLKGPLIGLEEDQLYKLAYGREVSLWEKLKSRADESDIHRSAVEFLARLLADVDYLPPFEFYSRVLGAHRGREKLVGRLGPDAQDPIAEFLNLALAYEKSHTPSLEGFLYWIEAGAVEVKRDLEQAQPGAVRVMTVHGAKGLQAPIVFLPDTLQAQISAQALYWPESDTGENQSLLWPPRRGLFESVAEKERKKALQLREQEYRRLLYVAMTRAEDRLYVCGWRTKKSVPDGCWYNIVEQGLRSIGTDLEELEDGFLTEEGETESNTILRLTCPQKTAVESPVSEIEEELQPLSSWALSLPKDEPLPLKPLTPSRPDGEEPAVLSPLAGDDGQRFKRGRIIHALLQTLPDIDAADRLEAASIYLGQPTHGLTEQEQDEIKQETLAVLEHPEFKALFGPGSRAEVPLVGEVAGQIISAQLDRLLIGSEEILVVDYKTNRPPPKDSSQVPGLYLRQMAAYRTALSDIYANRPVKCALLWTDGARLMPLDGTLLDRHAPLNSAIVE